MIDLCFIQCDQQCLEQAFSFAIYYGAGTLLFMLLISGFHIYMHLHHFTNSLFQSKIIVILLMAPCYGISSLISIMQPHISIYVTLVRDIYEAFLLFTFFYLMVAYMAYDEKTGLAIDEQVYHVMITQEHREVHHFWPFNYCTHPYKLTCIAKAKYFTYRCKKYILQYFVLKPLFAIILIIAQPFLLSQIISFLTFILNFIIVISVSYSLYYLILFYHALKIPLAPYKPLMKFLVIKITLFFTFWQTVTLQFLEEDLMRCFQQDEEFFEQERIIISIESVLINTEMVLMSLAAGIAFSYTEFLTNENKKGNISDVFKDNWNQFKQDFRLIKPKKFGFTSTVELRELEQRWSLKEESEIEMKVERMSKLLNYNYV